MALRLARTRARSRFTKRTTSGLEALFAPKGRTRKVPFDFVLDVLADAGPETKLFFGTTAVYVGDKIVFVLREKPGSAADNGVWLATTSDHHASLRPELPSMRSITVFGGGETGWQVLPADGDGFEEEVTRACELVLARDPRIGKVPKKKTPRKPKPRPNTAPSKGPSKKPKPRASRRARASR